jgi:hypothetical protein
MDREDGMGKSEIGRARYDTIANEISLFMEPGVFSGRLDQHTRSKRNRCSASICRVGSWGIYTFDIKKDPKREKGEVL